MDPVIVFLKALMVFGICFSIQLKVRTENGNLQADVDIKKKSLTQNDDGFSSHDEPN
jgi:hypothetical protein